MNNYALVLKMSFVCFSLFLTQKSNISNRYGHFSHFYVNATKNLTLYLCFPRNPEKKSKILQQNGNKFKVHP